VFRGALDAAPARSARASARGAAEGTPMAAWSGDIASDDAAYTVRAFEKQGKTSMYFTLSFDRVEKSAQTEPAFES
jgi:hypothetical protein